MITNKEKLSLFGVKKNTVLSETKSKNINSNNKINTLNDNIKSNKIITESEK